MNSSAKRCGRPPRSPSVESQTMAFLEIARKSLARSQAKYLTWDSITVYLRYWRTDYLPAPWDQCEVLVIARVEIPKRYQRRNWFWRYCQLCAALVSGGVVIESVLNKDFCKALRRHPEFIEYQDKNFFLHKKHPLDWPLTLDWLSFPDGPQYVGRYRQPEPPNYIE